MANASKKVADVVAKINSNKSARFSRGEYTELIYALIQDDSHTFKKFALKGDQITEDGETLSRSARKFFSKLLKHAGLKTEEEINSVLDTFEYSPKDVEWISDIVDEAIRIYTDSGKSVVVMKDALRRLTLKKVERTGKFNGQITYRRTVKDLPRAAEKAKNKKAD